VFSHVAGEWAEALSDGHRAGYLLIEDVGMAFFRGAAVVDGQLRLARPGLVIGALPDGFLECDALVQEDGVVVGLARGRVRARSSGRAALMGVSEEW
jgi:hypothetical protein